MFLKCKLNISVLYNIILGLFIQNYTDLIMSSGVICLTIRYISTWTHPVVETFIPSKK